MGSNSLSARSGGQTVEADDVNQYRNAFIGDHVPRNAAGAAEDQEGNLGSPSLQWGNLYFAGQAVQAGNVLDFTELVGEGHRILSGEADTSGYPEYLTFVAASTTGRIFAANTDLVMVINTASVTLNTNIDITSLSVAPSSNNTCLVNAPSLSGQASSKTLGEYGEALTIDTVGSEITALNGTVQAFKKGSEYFYALIDTGNNRLFPFRRGVARSAREALSDNDTITLMQANWIFLDADGTNTYTSTIFPSYESTDPASASNKWYFNTTSKRWRRYSGSWSNMEAHLLGAVIVDDTECVAADPADIDLKWGHRLEGQLYKVDASKVRVGIKSINVAGVNHLDDKYGQVIDLSVSGDRESGVSESSSTRYYIYADQFLKFRFSDKAPRPYDRRLGRYHPSEYWRYIGYVDNDSSSNLETPVWDNGQVRAEPFAPKKFREGLKPTWASVNSITIDTGLCLDSAGKHLIEVASPLTIDISIQGANGREGASETNGAPYYLYIIDDSSGTNPVAGFASVNDVSSGDSITLPSGYDKYRQLKTAWFNNSSGDLVDAYITNWDADPVHRFKGTSGFSGGTFEVLAAGTATSYTDVDLSAWVPTNAEVANINTYTAVTGGGGSASGTMYVRPDGATTNGYALYMKDNDYTHVQIADMPILCPNQVIEYKGISNFTLSLSVNGFVVTKG